MDQSPSRCAPPTPPPHTQYTRDTHRHTRSSEQRLRSGSSSCHQGGCPLLRSELVRLCSGPDARPLRRASPGTPAGTWSASSCTTATRSARASATPLAGAAKTRSSAPRPSSPHRSRLTLSPGTSRRSPASRSTRAATSSSRAPTTRPSRAAWASSTSPPCWATAPTTSPTRAATAARTRTTAA